MKINRQRKSLLLESISTNKRYPISKLQHHISLKLQNPIFFLPNTDLYYFDILLEQVKRKKCPMKVEKAIVLAENKFETIDEALSLAVPHC
jgi:hypothetical protein